MAQKSQKMTKQELRAPDAFQRVGVEAENWLLARQKLVAAVLVALFAGGALLALGSYFSKRGEEKAAKALGEVLQIMNRPVVAADLKPLGDEAPPFKSEKEKDEALKKGLEDFRAQHGGTRAALTAALALGEADYRLGDQESALAAFGDYLAKAPNDDALRGSALEGQGHAYEAQGQYEKALGSFEQMTKEAPGEHEKNMGQYHRARMLVLLDRKEEAAKVLSELKTAHPDSAAARLATERLAVLMAEGVKVPEPSTASEDAG